MSKIVTWCIGLALVGAFAGCGPAVVRAAGSWGRAVEMPGLGALYTGGGADVFSVSCVSAGSCAAGGRYQDRRGHDQGFVAAERHGAWGQAVEVPGLAALNKGGGADVLSVSCASPGSCAAGGLYTDRHGHSQGFVAAERNGRWGQAVEVPGLGALNTGGNAYVFSVSCASAGSCAAAGDYRDGDGHWQGFVADERHGRWGTAIEVPGLAALNKGGAKVSSVSCASAGSCAAGGYYTDGGGNSQGFVAAETNGAWGQAVEVPGLAALNKGDAKVSSVSCAWAGSCAAGGYYSYNSANSQGFVASETNGRWGQAIELPGLAALGIDNTAVDSVSCASAGNCAAGGDDSPYGFGFVASENKGVWGQAIELPGLRALATGAQGRAGATVGPVSCGSPGNCAAAGYYADGAQNLQGFVAVEKNGAWGQAIELPGLGALNSGGGAYVSEVSCAPDGGCSAGGFYTDRHDHSQGFVVSQTG